MTISMNMHKELSKPINYDEFDVITDMTFEENYENAKSNLVPYYLFCEVHTNLKPIRLYELHSFSAYLINQGQDITKTDTLSACDPLMARITEVNCYAKECFQIHIHNASGESLPMEKSPTITSFPSEFMNTVMYNNGEFDLGCFIDVTNPHLNNLDISLLDLDNLDCSGDSITIKKLHTILDHYFIIEEFEKHDPIEAFRWTISLYNKCTSESCCPHYEYSYDSFKEMKSIISDKVVDIYDFLRMNER